MKKTIYVLVRIDPNGDKQLGKGFVDSTQAQEKVDELTKIAKENDFHCFYGYERVTVTFGFEHISVEEGF